ncbi:MAG: FG-GAP repeat protein [Gammaproteobacteria bacterium]|nr:FG-GAP repeat protein [Gammaproteobacteria bacterium]
MSETQGNFEGGLSINSEFGSGSAIAVIGDLEADGVGDLIVGAPFENNLGTVWILFMDEPDTRTGCERDAPLRFPGIGDCN